MGGILLLQDGRQFVGEAFGATTTRVVLRSATPGVGRSAKWNWPFASARVSRWMVCSLASMPITCTTSPATAFGLAA